MVGTMTTTLQSPPTSGGGPVVVTTDRPNKTGAIMRSNIPSLVAAFSAALTTGGTTYAFGLYGNDLKKSLRLSAGQLDTISTAFFFAGLFSWIPGWIADKYGTRFTIALGGITGATSLIAYWLVAVKYIIISRTLLVPVLSVLGIAIFVSCALVTGSVFKTIVVCCGAGTRGSAVGVAKGYVGLGSGAYACLFESIRAPGRSNLDFLPMAAFFFIVCATIPALVLLPTKQQMMSNEHQIRDVATPRHFRVLFGSLIMMAVLVIGNSLVSLMDESNNSSSSSSSSSSTTSTQLLSAEGNARFLLARFLAGGGNNKHGSSSGDDGRHWGTAFLILTAWLAPIASLLYLPVKLDDDFIDDAIAFEPVSQTPPLDNDEEGGGANDRHIVMISSNVDNASRGDISLKKIPLSKKMSPSRSISELTAEEGRPLNNVSESSTRRVGANSGSNTDSSDNEDDVNHDEDRLIVNRTESNEEDLPEENLNMLQMLRTPSALLMLWTTTILVGAGTVMTNNLGEMVESMHFPERVTSASLALFSVAQSAARVVTGAVSEMALSWNTKRFGISDGGIPRPFFLVVASCVAFMSHLLLGVVTQQYLFVLATAATGIAFGMVWPLMVLITGEVFGTANAGANYMFYDGFTSAIGTLLLTKMLAQGVYEKHIEPSDNPDGDNTTCYGMPCFQKTHIVVALLSLSCVITSGIMMYTSRHTYNRHSRVRRHHRS